MTLSQERWKQIEELYDAAVDLKPAEQSVVLGAADPDIGKVVSRMLMQNKTGILDKPAWEVEALASSEMHPIQPGSTIGPYRIESKVGAGGMGEVYQAWDTRLARKVALKAIRADQEFSGLETRFLEEARAASALNHPNIVTIYDVGEIDDFPYIVMEWIDGKTLRQRLTEGSFAMPEIFGIASQVTDALAAAHEAGVVHRDLKPENIMVTADGRAKVLDFGIAKRVAEPEGNTVELGNFTVPGAIIGTPGYMSPEQARGEDLDFRSDQFSFGAVLYEMVTCRRAFSGRSVADVQGAILFHQPEPLTHINPQAPAPLQWIVDRCLSKLSQDRFASTAELRRELSAVIAGTSQHATRVAAIENLPSPRTALIGREDELSRLERLLADPGIHLLTLTGPGGIGKTRLALELCRQVSARFGGGVCFVPLDKVNQADLVPSEIIHALGVTQAPGDIPDSAIRRHLFQHAAGPVLLLLDNFEHVLGAAAFVGGLASERLRIVVTSRAALRVYGEYEFLVPSMGGGEASDAVRLFLDRAPALRGSGNDKEQLRIIGEICARLDGLPLAIELAAARTKLLPLKALRDRLKEPLAVLVGGARDLPKRQHTLRATLDWSYNLLDAEHQKLFRRMAVFVGGAPIEAVEAVCNTREDLQVNLWDAMELLSDNSLIRRAGAEDAEPRFAMLETMREYALERLTEAGEIAYTQKARAAYCLVMAEAEAPNLRRERSGKHRFDADLGNFRAALDWLTSAGEAEWGLRLAMALGTYFYSLRLSDEGYDRISRLLALPNVTLYPRLFNWGRFWQADFAFEGCFDPSSYLKIWRAFHEAGDEQGMLHAATRLGFNSKNRDFSEARRWAEYAVDLARKSFPISVLAGALSNLADVVKDREFAYARALYLEASRLFEESGETENAIWSLSHQGDLCLVQGKVEEARSLYKEALAKFKSLPSLYGVASCLHDLAGLEVSDGRLDEAERMYQECLRLYGAENKSDLPRVVESLAALSLEKREPERALMLFGAAEAIRDRFQVRDLRRPSQVEAQTLSARKLVSDGGVTHWMSGWKMGLDEVIAFARQGAEDQWTISQRQ
jgi:predicted ATPase/serine/threonine protein kinase